MAKRTRRATINPWQPIDPYGEKPRNAGTSVLGPNMFDQQGQKGLARPLPMASGL
jgi:hypothetical protein